MARMSLQMPRNRPRTKESESTKCQRTITNATPAIIQWKCFRASRTTCLKKCPKCGKNKLRRLFGTGAAIVFKGSGFYQTDYRSDSYKKGEKAAKDAKSESKSEGKSDSKKSDSGSKKQSKKGKSGD